MGIPPIHVLLRSQCSGIPSQACSDGAAALHLFHPAFR